MRLRIDRDYDWRRLGEEIEARHKLLKVAVESLKDTVTDEHLRIKLATTDIFVEKAQLHLTRRATHKYWLAIMCSVLIVCLLLYFFFFATKGFFDLLSNPKQYNDLNAYSFTLILFQKLLISGVVFAGTYFLASMIRALLHEATTLLNRRHAMRFGRLIVYLKNGEVDEQTIRDNFGWNLDMPTAFLGLRADIMSRGLLTKFAEAVEKVVSAVAGAKKSEQK